MFPLPFKVGAVLLLAAASSSAVSNEQERAPRIGNIEIISSNVFHEAENDDGFWVYRFANKLHVQTRKDIILQELLFVSGDTLDPKILAETERNLRSLIFIRDAKIETTPGDNGTVDIRVQTFDAWSTVPELSFAKVGNEFIWGVGASERNLLGRGKQLEFTFRRGLQRDSTNLFYRDPRVGGSRVAATIGYSDLSDGGRGQLSLLKPFHSLQTKWAFSFRLLGFDQLAPLYFNGERVIDLRHVGRFGKIDVARAVRRTSTSAVRLHLGYRKQEDQVEGVFRDFGVLQIGISTEQHRFLKLTHVNRFEVAEDFNLGNQAAAFFGASTPALGGEPGTTYFFFLSEQIGADLGIEHFIRGRATWRARHRRGEWENTLAVFRLDYVNKMAPRRTFLALARLLYGSNLNPEVQLILGAQNGLRGYPVFQFAGDRSLLFSAEQRFFIADDVFRLASFALGVFADVGYAWPQPVKISLGDLKADVGVALLIGRNRLSATRPGVRFDLAYALHPVAGRSRWLFSVGSKIGL